MGVLSALCRGRLLGAIAAVALAAFAASSLPLDAAYADPPPWAPAHGWRAKHKHKKEKYVYYREVPYDIGIGRCNRDLIGAVLGGTVGGAIGSQIGDGAGRTVATVGGVLVGAVVGGAIGRRMDDRDRACVAHALDLAPDGRAVSWANPETGARYELRPLGLYQAADGRSCREYVTEAVIEGESRRIRGVACRAPDGAWQPAS